MLKLLKIKDAIYTSEDVPFYFFKGLKELRDNGFIKKLIDDILII
jgi:hypothetical protein